MKMASAEAFHDDVAHQRYRKCSWEISEDNLTGSYRFVGSRDDLNTSGQVVEASAKVINRNEKRRWPLLRTWNSEIHWSGRSVFSKKSKKCWCRSQFWTLPFQGSARTASEELQLQQQPPSDEDIYRRREEEAAAARRRREEEEEEWRRREEEERRRIAEEEIQRRRELEEERLRREYEAEVARRWREEEEERARREANKPQFIARALYSFNGQTEK